jgi:hypothetical protein
LPTSGRGSIAPHGVGDDWGIAFSPNTSVPTSRPRSASRRTLPSANAGHSDWRSPGPTVFRCGSPASKVVRFAATVATELRAAMRPIEGPSRRSATRYALRTYAIGRGAGFGTNDRWTGSHRLSSLSSLQHRGVHPWRSFSVQLGLHLRASAATAASMTR